MRMYDLIEKKKLGMELTTDEIRFMIDGFTDGTIPDYQMSAMTMAICFQGMSKRETVDLTLAMRDSGDVLDLSSIPGLNCLLYTSISVYEKDCTTNQGNSVETGSINDVLKKICDRFPAIVLPGDCIPAVSYTHLGSNQI